MAPPPRWVTNAGGTVKGGAKRFDDTAIGAGLDCIHDATKTRGSEQAGHEAAQGR